MRPAATRTIAATIAMLPLFPLFLCAGCGDEEATTTYEVSIAVTTDSGPIAALQFDVFGPNAAGGWDGAGGAIACTKQVAVELATFNDRGSGRLSAALVDLAGFSTPTVVAKCTYRSLTPLTPEDFQAVVIDASGTNVDIPLDPFPEMAVTSVVPTRSLEPLPSSTLGEPPGGPRGTFAVTVGVTTSSGQLAALQFDVRHTAPGGGWVGAGSRVVCTADVPVALATFNDHGSAWLSAALVDLSGFPTPGPVATCSFASSSTPRMEDFQVTVVDASGTDVDVRPDPFPTMAVTRLQPLAP